MAHLEIGYLDYLVQAPDALDNSFVVNSPHSYQQEKTYVIEVVAGSIQFCFGQPVQAQSPIHSAGAKIVFTALAKTKIYYKANAGGDQFTVGF